MKAQELMIGNYLRYPNTEPFILDLEDIRSKNFWSDFFEGIIEPVPLTEDWLIELGFNDIEDKLYCKRWRLNRVDIYKMVSGSYPFYFRFNQVDLKIKYVHQLQNLYFALTQTELTIK